MQQLLSSVKTREALHRFRLVQKLCKNGIKQRLDGKQRRGKDMPMLQFSYKKEITIFW